MAKGATTENDLLKLIFNSTALSGSWGTNLYVALHTADPSAGNQSTSEVSYTGYARVAVTRADNTAWTVSTNTAQNAGVVAFGQATSGSFPITATHFSIGLSASGAGQIVYSGALGSSLVINNNIIPEFLANQITTTET